MRWPWLLLLVVLLLTGPARASETSPEPETLVELVDRLGHPVYAERRDARRRLVSRGLSAFDALRAGRDSADPEIAQSCRGVLAELTSNWVWGGEPGRARQRLDAYGKATLAEERTRLIESLNRLPHQEGIEALVRIARFESRDLIARTAAEALLKTPDTLGDRIALRKGRFLITRVGVEIPLRRAEAIVAAKAHSTETHGPGQRPAARWVALVAEELSGETSPVDATAAWRQAAEEAITALRSGQKEVTPEIVATLWRRALHSALRADDPDAADEAVARLVEVLPDAADVTVITALSIAGKASAWGCVDRFRQTHADRITGKRALYGLGEIASLRGQPDEAQRLAEQALAAPITLTPTSSEAFAYDPRVVVINELIRRGHDGWAEREFDAVVTGAEPSDGAAAVARWEFADARFDAGQYAETAEALRPLFELAAQTPSAYHDLPQAKLRLLPAAPLLRARFHFASALAARERGDQATEIRQLERALDADSGDADILIAMHRVRDPSEAFAERTRERIEQLKSDLESEVWGDLDGAELGGRADALNHWAWLVSNTTGDYDKAIRYSKRSLELLPETAGLLDTLARCHFAAGDLAEAVRVQRHAVELDPHTKTLRRQLTEFEAALAEEQAE